MNRSTVNRACGVCVAFCEQIFSESVTKTALFFASVIGRDEMTRKECRQIRYDRACGLAIHLLNMWKIEEKQPGFMPKILKETFTKDMIENIILDLYHCKNHKKPMCNIDVCKKQGKNVRKECRFDPRLNKHKWPGKVNDQVCEQNWSKWGKYLAPILRTSTRYTFFWFVHVFKECQNEIFESNREVYISGMSPKGGYRPMNW